MKLERHGELKLLNFSLSLSRALQFGIEVLAEFPSVVHLNIVWNSVPVGCLMKVCWNLFLSES